MTGRRSGAAEVSVSGREYQKPGAVPDPRDEFRAANVQRVIAELRTLVGGDLFPPDMFANDIATSASVEASITDIDTLISMLQKNTSISQMLILDAMWKSLGSPPSSVLKPTTAVEIARINGTTALDFASEIYVQASKYSDEEREDAKSNTVEEAAAARAEGAPGGLDPAVIFGVEVGIFEWVLDEEGDRVGVIDRLTEQRLDNFIDGEAAGPGGVPLEQFIRETYGETANGPSIIAKFINEGVFQATIFDIAESLRPQEDFLIGVPDFSRPRRQLSFSELGGVEGARDRTLGTQYQKFSGEEPSLFATGEHTPQYRDGDAQKELAMMSPEEIAMIQADLIEGGVLPVSGVRLGVADANTVAGVENAMITADQEGFFGRDAWKTAVEFLRLNPFPASQAGGSLPDAAFRPQDIDSLRQTVKDRFRATLGRDPSDAELHEFASALSGEYREAFEAEQEAVTAAEAGGMLPETARDLIRSKISEGVGSARDAVLAQITGGGEEGGEFGRVPLVDPVASFQEALEARYTHEIDRNQRVVDARTNRNNLMGSIFRMDSSI